MTFYKYRGKRIRASDKSLVYRFCGSSLLFLFVMVVLLLNMGQLMRTDWNTFSLIRNDGLAFSLSLYNYITIFIAAGICLAAALVFRHYCRDYVKQLYHRQKLAKMVLENKWYEAEQVQSDGFFKDLSSSRSKEKISYFPKIYYQLKNGLIHIRVEITRIASLSR